MHNEPAIKQLGITFIELTLSQAVCLKPTSSNRRSCRFSRASVRRPRPRSPSPRPRRTARVRTVCTSQRSRARSAIASLPRSSPPPRPRATRRRRPSTHTVAEPEAALEQGDAPVPIPARPAQKRRPSFRAEASIDMTPDPTPTGYSPAVTTRQICAVAPARAPRPAVACIGPATRILACTRRRLARANPSGAPRLYRIRDTRCASANDARGAARAQRPFRYHRAPDPSASAICGASGTGGGTAAGAAPREQLDVCRN
ncbi:hypothetical protein GGX14DRAFT_401109 [Mycena pura]|uniref:Uncharacterized protein n=1 Tax=Mycena pura TaxID=153505 RepID=A0AAD6Y8T7_9AGAR|nr:hypothetical protein GGX14DRAFT_401109 [Mycena pura]